MVTFLCHEWALAIEALSFCSARATILKTLWYPSVIAINGHIGINLGTASCVCGRSCHGPAPRTAVLEPSTKMSRQKPPSREVNTTLPTLNVRSTLNLGCLKSIS